MLKQIDQFLDKIKFFLERTTPLGILAQKRRQKRGTIRPTEMRVEENGSPPLPQPKFESPEVKQLFSRMFEAETSRLDYIIIWGHGIEYKHEIVNMIRSHKDFKIIKIICHYPKSIRSLVKTVYSYDYAPLSHLKPKTKYLMKTPKEVLFIFFENMNPDEDYFGNGIFRHFESATLKQFKEEIRDKFNERLDGKRTENHVIHASDNQLQTHKILQYLGFEGVSAFRGKNRVFELPFHARNCSKFLIKNVPVDSLVCAIGYGIQSNFSKIKIIPIKQSPHYIALAGNSDHYQEYKKKVCCTTHYSIEAFKKLAYNFNYLTEPYSTNYIVVRPLDNDKFQIIDGLHRAAILCYKNQMQLTVVICEQD